VEVALAVLGGERAEAWAERVRLRGREAAREVVECRGAPGGLVAEELNLARAEIAGALDRVAETIERGAGEDDVRADLDAGLCEEPDRALGVARAVEAADLGVRVAGAVVADVDLREVDERARATPRRGRGRSS
jgi:hypothetical protein